MNEDLSESLLRTLEELKNLTSVITGLRNDLIQQGWAPSSAEEIAITAWRKMMLP